MVLSMLGDAESEDYSVGKNGVGGLREEYIFERDRERQGVTRLSSILPHHGL
jgi:hypothetical protein